MYSYKIRIKKVSGRLNESALPKKNMIVKSHTKKSNKTLFAEADAYLRKNYGLTLESADIASADAEEVFNQMRSKVESQRTKSAWDRGVKAYALDMVDKLEEVSGGKVPSGAGEMMDLLLNGARDWKQASDGGSWFVYDEDIAERLCGPSELKKVAGGKRRPNSHETWIDVQARALQQASDMLVKVSRSLLG